MIAAYLLVAVFLPFGVLSERTNVKQCSGIPAALEVRVHGCINPPCLLKRGEDAIVDVDFEVPRNTKEITPKVRAFVLGIPISYPLPPDQSIGCDNLIEGYCPLDKEEVVTYRLKMPITAEYPAISLELELKLNDDSGAAVACFKVDVKVVA